MEHFPDVFNQKLKVKCLLDSASAILFLHQLDIMYRDLKPNNILVVSLKPHSEVCAKLTDFGTARDLNPFKKEVSKTQVGSTNFMAPELINAAVHNKSVDTYSFAMVMFYIFSGEIPFKTKDAVGLIQSVNSGERPDIPSTCPPEISELMQKGWKGEPSERPSFETIHDVLDKLFTQLMEKEDLEEKELNLVDLPKRYLNDEVIVPDKEKAAELYLRSAILGNSTGMNNYGLCCFKGEGVDVNKKKAVELFSEAVELGNCTAMCNLGWCYFHGQGVAQDKKRGVELLQRAVNLGDANAMDFLSLCYFNGAGVPMDTRKAVDLLHRAVDLGNVNAMCTLGFCYLNGAGITRDREKATKLLQQAADKGCTNAMCSLGISYFNGDGVAQDREKAIVFFQRAADLGNSNAMYQLGRWYFYGNGVEQNKQTAIRWPQRASDLGNPYAMEFLALCYEKGDGVQQDNVKAKALLYVSLFYQQVHADSPTINHFL